jgi:hypothetical protein
MMAENRYWFSYDLGFNGDYQGLYAWLDSVGAIECGDSVAFFEKEYLGSPLKSMLEDIKQFVAVNQQTRLYVIYSDPKTGKVKGKFLIGRRKRAPWWGYSPVGLESQED